MIFYNILFFISLYPWFSTKRWACNVNKEIINMFYGFMNLLIWRERQTQNKHTTYNCDKREKKQELKIISVSGN